MIDNHFSMEEIIDSGQIQRLADRFCVATNVFAYAVNEDGEQITRLSGQKSDTDKMAGYLDKEQAAELAERVKIGSLEEQVVEQTKYGNMMAAAIAIHIEKRHILTWIIYGVLEEQKEEIGIPFIQDVTAKITEPLFYHVLDLLRDSSYAALENKISMANARAESVRSRNSESEAERSSKRIEASAKIVQLLDSDEKIEKVITDALRIIGEHLEVSSAQFYQFHRENNTMDVITQWRREGVIPVFDKTKGIKAFSFFNMDKPLVLSADSFESTDAGERLSECGMKALIVFPIQVQGEKEMYLGLMDNSPTRMWQVEDIKFIGNLSKILQSIIYRHVQQNALTKSYDALDAILDKMHSGVYIRDAKSKEVLFANKNLKEVFATELFKGTLNELLEQSMPVHRASDNLELYYKELDQWYDLLYTETVWTDGREAELFCLYDITDRKIYQRKMEQQAYTDMLTGLYNRMCCERDMAKHVDNAKKKKETGAVLYLDLDDFKHINDGLGHQYGDILLKAISNNLKEIDGVGNNCYRVGGDEFVIIITSENYPKLNSILTEIKRIFSKPWYLKNADYYCTMSMGVVKYPEDGEGVQDLIAKSDIAMYEAKRSGKNRVETFSEEFNISTNKRLDMERGMRAATVNGCEEFEVYFQPIIDIQKPGTPCTGAEALLRWNSSKMGLVAPSEFIPLAEYLGLINPIGNYALKTACSACKAWNDNGYPEYKVNVNLSVIQLLQPDIVDSVAQTITETGIDPKNLTLEVTESLAINDMNRMKEILGNIKKLGVRIALDDFGTGYSSLNHIREIPFDVIKVDQSFVKGLAEDTYSQSFIKMVSELADTIGVSICVEGIETKAQYKVLEGMKVRMVQGYYFGRPMKQELFEEKYCQ